MMRTTFLVAFVLIISVSSIISQEAKFIGYDNLIDDDRCVYSDKVIGFCTKIADCLDEREKYLNREVILLFCDYEDNICCTHPSKPVNLNETQAYSNDYFDINQCRDRNLIWRRTNKNYLENRIDNSSPDDNFFNILNGRQASEHGWAFMAAIGWTNADDESVKYNCGGVIISERFILTAAHCRTLDKVEPRIVRVGDRFLNRVEDDDHAQQLEIEKIIFHEKYKLFSHYYDIGLIKTKETIIFNNHVTPACIADINDYSDLELRIAGYGQYNMTKTEVANVLSEITVKTSTYTACNHAFEFNSKVADGIKSDQICTISEKNQEGRVPDACQGDSGGPVMYNMNYTVNDENFQRTGLRTVYKIPVVVGVVSFGSSCGLEGIPSVNTKVFSFKNWILQEMNSI